jgi:hypothetical protein
MKNTQFDCRPIFVTKWCKDFCALVWLFNQIHSFKERLNTPNTEILKWGYDNGLLNVSEFVQMRDILWNV